MACNEFFATHNKTFDLVYLLLYVKELAKFNPTIPVKEAKILTDKDNDSVVLQSPPRAARVARQWVEICNAQWVSREPRPWKLPRMKKREPNR